MLAKADGGRVSRVTSQVGERNWLAGTQATSDSIGGKPWLTTGR
jgi:hypothetical protein